MKLLFLLGNAAVGKMTVGQELMKLTGLRLFHNHMTIEPVLEIFGSFDGRVIGRLREVIFEEFAASQNEGMIFTLMLDFDSPEDWAYLEHIKEIFLPYGTTFYYVELVASQEVRLQRNKTENRLHCKTSKQDVAASEQRLIADDRMHRCVSREGEVPFPNYLRLDNSALSAKEAATTIQLHFGL